MDPSIVAFNDLLGEYVGRVSAAMEKIVGQVLDVAKVVASAEDSSIRIYNEKQKHAFALELGKRLVKEETDWSRYLDDRMGSPIVEATEKGIIELVNEILQKFPEAVFSFDKNTRAPNDKGKNILHIAVEQKDWNIYDLLRKKIELRDGMLVGDVDNHGNTILHLAAKLGALSFRSIQRGPLYQMMWDVCWFKHSADVNDDLTKLTGAAIDLSLKGSPHWMAPEVLQAAMRKDSNPHLAYAVDIWSVGCTVIEMLDGKPPWSEFTPVMQLIIPLSPILYVQAMFNVLNKSPTIPETLSPEGKDFLQRCFQRNPADRPSAAWLLDHPFLQSSLVMDHSPRDKMKNMNGSLPTSPGAGIRQLPRNGSCRSFFG
ncbi:hypothetical protein RHSIM_Rhsim06G0042500 [Rhododendron simsii]|uniref:Protein kinase domain-containing protein n=1 Tax=Rhododendron simsii TaxID=118357 RepID=A0A834LJU9_RHOSS|nr:hypothetical protein RHSIM_Rhsim06G0042500 [Rhododendron simsii]